MRNSYSSWGLNLELVLPRSPGAPGSALVAAWAIKMGHISNSILGPMGTTTNKPRTDHSTNKQKAFLCGRSYWSGKARMRFLVGRAWERDGGKSGCFFLPWWKLVYPRTCFSALGNCRRLSQRCPRQLWNCPSHWPLHQLSSISRWSFFFDCLHSMTWT